MKLEHIGLRVQDPFGMAKWYQDNLGFSILLQNGSQADGAAFAADSSGQMLIEFFSRPDTPALEFVGMAPLQLHIAVQSDDPEADCARLTQAGALFIERSSLRQAGDLLILMRDPWGMALQLVKRSRPLSG